MTKLKTGRHTSALKELRKSLRRRERNLKLKNAIKSTRKRIIKAITEKDINTAKSLLSQFYKIVDKAAKRNYIHQNKAARLKSSLTEKVNLLANQLQEKKS